MERDGLLTRTVYDENPPRVEYALTPLGRTLIPLLDAARSWSEAHLPALLAARHADRRRGPAPESPGRYRAVDPAS